MLRRVIYNFRPTTSPSTGGLVCCMMVSASDRCFNTHPTQSKPLAAAQLRSLMSPEHYSALSEYSEFFGTPIQSLIDEALKDYVEVSVASRWEVWTETMRRNDRAEKAAEKRREEGAYLAKLEIELDPLSSPL